MKLLKVLLIIFSILSLTATGFLYYYAGQIYLFDHLVIGFPEMFLCVSALWIFTMGMMTIIGVENIRNERKLLLKIDQVKNLAIQERGMMQAEINTVTGLLVKEREVAEDIKIAHKDALMLLAEELDATKRELTRANTLLERPPVDPLYKLLSDPELRRAWKDNIAMAFKDNYKWHMKKKRSPSFADIHTIGNKAAEYFLKLLIGK